MARRSDEALAGLLGLGSQSARKSHYPELLARLEELETERNRYKWLFEHAVHGIIQASLQDGVLAANPAMARMLGYDDPQQVLWSLGDLARHLFVGGFDELAVIRERLSRGQALLGYETRLRRRDGSTIDVLMNLLLKPEGKGSSKASSPISPSASRRSSVCNSSMTNWSAASPREPSSCSNPTATCSGRSRSASVSNWPCVRRGTQPRRPTAARTSTWPRPAMICCNR